VKKRILNIILVLLMVVGLLPSFTLTAKAAPQISIMNVYEPIAYNFTETGGIFKQNGSTLRAYVEYSISKSNLSSDEQALWEAGKVTAMWYTEVLTGPSGLSWSWYTTYLFDGISPLAYSTITPAETVTINNSYGFNNEAVKFYENKGEWRVHHVTKPVPYNSSVVGGTIMQPPNNDINWGSRDYGWRNQNSVYKTRNGQPITFLRLTYGNDSAYPFVLPLASTIISGQTLSASTLSYGKVTAYGAYTNLGNNASNIQGTFKWYDSSKQMLSSGPARIDYDPAFVNFSTNEYFKNTVQNVNVTVRAAYITLDKTGGSGGSASAEGWYGSNLSDITIPTLNNYKFNGYYSAASGGTQYYDASGKSTRNWDVAADTTLYAQWEVANYTASVTVNKDGSLWADHGKNFGLYQSGTKKYDLNVSGSTATISALTGTYDVYEGASDTGVDIVVSPSGTNTATLNYFTLELSADAGTYSPNGGGIYLAGRIVPIDVMVNSGYTWNQWTSNNTALFGNISTKSTNITMPSGAVTLTANTTLNSYTISYNLNGGTATNPQSYQYTTPEFTLSNPTRNGYSFVGWNGTGLAGNDNQLVTISTASTGDKTYTANWKANTPAAPEASIVTARADTSFTITTETEYEYSLGGTNWFSGTGGSYTFAGLTAGTSYNLVRRVAAVTNGDTSAASETSPALAVSTKNAAPAAPSISITSASQNLIIVGSVDGAEYSKDNGVNWQIGNSFGGLTPSTQYTFAIRIKETDDTVAGIKATGTQYTSAATPTVGEGYSFSYSTEMITIASGYQVSSNSDLFAENLVANNSTINPGTTYYVRVAESGGVPASDHVAFALPPRPEAPSAIDASKIANSITITQIVGQEYKLNSGVWQDSGSFTGLSPNTDYTVYARVKATGITFASAEYSMSVTTKSVANVTVPTLSAVTYNPAATLAGITLPTGWAWSAPSTVPTVAISSYDAVYTPTDTATVDYSGVTGYANTSGTVTITQAIGLTVNRTTPTAEDFNYTPPASLDYSGTSKTVTVVAKGGISGMGTVTVKYYTDGGETPSVNAGIYEVKIDIAEGANYAAVTQLTDDAWKFSIAKVPQESLSITSTTASITYGDTFTLATSGGSGTGLVTWAVTDGNSATVDESTGFVTITGVNETTITVTKAADDNHATAITDTYTFTPDKLQLVVDSPTVDGGWTKVYDGSTEFDKSFIKVGGITNKVGEDDVTVSVASANYDTADVDTGKELTIVYTIDGVDIGLYSIADDTVISNASVTPATPVVALVDKIMRYNQSIVDIDPAKVTGIAVENDITTNYDGVVTYIYYTKDTCTDDDKTTVNRSGAETIGGAPKYPGTYYVKAFVPANGNYSVATSTVAMLRIYNPSSGGNSTLSTPQEPTNTNVIVNGESTSAGTETKTILDGKTTTLIQVNNEVVESKIEEAVKNNATGVGNNIQITSADIGSEVVAFELTGDTVKKLEQNGFDVSVKNNDIEYIIPAKEFTISKVAQELNILETDLKEIKVAVKITKLDDQIIKQYNQVAKDNGAELIFPPVTFEVVANTTRADGSTGEVIISKFSSYVERVMEIHEGVDPSKITTGIVFNQDGTYSHVPTEVFQKEGKWYARINSLTNSTYAVIWNPITVASVENHWSKAIVNDMASRLVIKNPETFMPNQNITRGEFAEYITKALGIHRAGITVTRKFADVETTHELAYAIELATAYGIINGYPDGTFKPDAQISREEAMVMYARAMDIVGLKEIDNGRIETYIDKELVAEWAYNHVKKTVSAGVFNGKTNETINPKDTFTNAEAATAIRNLLVASGLINK
jgi:uncharacterized repeat protein (TIGR02543 family)